jgi:cytochrome b561
MTDAYAAPRRALHWLTLVLLIGLYSVGWILEDIESAADRKMLLTAHQSIGLIVLILGAVRLIAAWRAPFHPREKLAGWIEASAKLTHLALYALMIALPLSGWLYTSAKGGSVNFFWVVRLPHLMSADDALADQLIEAHELIGIALLAVAALHVLAALAHYLVLRDGVLARMLPSLRRV